MQTGATVTARIKFVLAFQSHSLQITLGHYCVTTDSSERLCIKAQPYLSFARVATEFFIYNVDTHGHTLCPLSSMKC